MSARIIDIQQDGLNELVKNFLVELKNDAHRKASKMEFVYANALKSLKVHKDKITRISECRKLKYFGEKICSILDKKVDDYCRKHSLDSPVECVRQVDNSQEVPALDPNVRIRIEDEDEENFNGNRNGNRNENGDGDGNRDRNGDRNVNKISNIESDELITSNRVAQKKVTQKNKRQYVPKFKSSGFAIMIALYRLEQDENCFSVSKIDLIKQAEKYMNNSNNGDSTSAQLSTSMWSAMKTLIEKELVSVERTRCHFYTLTDLGRELSVKMYQALVDKLGLNFVADRVTTLDNHDEDDDIQNDDLDEPIVYLPNSYVVTLIIDSREQYSGESLEQQKIKLVSDLQNMGIDCEMRTLPVGDFAWIARPTLEVDKRELVFDFLVERKKTDDLIASIRDQRWGEQKYRLKRCGIPNIIYLIEGLQTIKSDHPCFKSMHTALANAQLVDEFIVKQTKDFKDTLSYLAMMTKYLTKYYTDHTLFSSSKKDKEAYPLRENHLLTFSEFSCDSLKMTTFTAKEMFVRSLMRFHGATLEKCKAITDQYSTLPSLLEAYDQCHLIVDKEQLLSSIEYGNPEKKIGSALSKMIYTYFTYQTVTE